MNSPQVLGKQILAAAKARGMSLNQLARDADMPRNHLTSIVKGRTKNPGVYTIAAISEALGVTMDQLVIAAETNS